mmetsp:Transcript_8445/g.26263  ORF Transcript_8445/g.26263 Transcript_8445/m.26263 type:complete len:276 (-) Transcript_8445:1729-2556(-)
MDPVGVVELLQLQQLAVLPALVLAGVRPHPVLSLYEQGAAVQIDREEPRGRLGPLQLHVVNRAEVVRQALRASSHKRLAHEDHDPVLLRHGLQAHRHVDVGGEVGGVDLVLAAYGALDGPAAVEAEAQVHAAPGAQALLQPRVEAVGGEDVGAVHPSEDLRKGEDGHVRQPHLLVLGHPSGAPDDQERVAVVLVRGPVELVHDSVHDLGDLVHESHDLLLQHLGRGAEVADPDAAHDAVHARALEHRVHAAVGALHVLADDVGARLTEAKGEERT